MEGEWSCYRGGQFNGGRMVMLQRVTLLGRMVNRRWFHGGRIVVTEVASLMEGEWSCYGGGQFNGGRMVMLRRWPV